MILASGWRSASSRAGNFHRAGAFAAEDRNRFTISGESTGLVGRVLYKKWPAAGARRGLEGAARMEEAREERSWMKLVLAGTEITSLISIKEREGPLLRPLRTDRRRLLRVFLFLSAPDIPIG